MYTIHRLDYLIKTSYVWSVPTIITLLLVNNSNYSQRFVSNMHSHGPPYPLLRGNCNCSLILQCEILTENSCKYKLLSANTAHCSCSSSYVAALCSIFTLPVEGRFMTSTEDQGIQFTITLLAEENFSISLSKEYIFIFILAECVYR